MEQRLNERRSKIRIRNALIKTVIKLKVIKSKVKDFMTFDFKTLGLSHGRNHQ